MRAYKIKDAVEAFYYEDVPTVMSGEFSTWMKQMQLECGIENDALVLWSTGKVVVPRPTLADPGSWLVVENNLLHVLTAAEFAAYYDTNVVLLEDAHVTCDRCGFYGQLHRGESGDVCVVNLEGLKAFQRRVV